METRTHLEAALKRLAVGTASKNDREAVRLALLNGVLAAGERSVAIGGNASDVIINTGDDSVVLSFTGTNVAKVQEILNSVAPRRLHELPSPPHDFTGRENEIAELSAKLEQGGVTISALHGLGGIGKTALALKLADQIKSQYPDAQFYLDLKGASSEPLTVAEAMAHIVRAYHPTAKVPHIEAELYGLYRSVLQDQRALLLMDNAAGAEQVEPLIPPRGCVLLVTSRRHFTLPGLFAKNLETLSPVDANKLLLTIAPRIDRHADEIARLCGNLPLALRLAGSALMKFTNLAPADYVQRLRDSKLQLQLIEASLNLSYKLLSDELQKWWRLLAVFPDTFEETAAAAIWNLEVERAQDVLGELIAASMVEWTESTRRYRLHDLARLFAAAQITTEERLAAQRLHATYYGMVLATADDLYVKGGEAVRSGLVLFDLEWRNIEVGHAWAVAQADGNDQAAQLCIGYSHDGVYVLYIRQHPRERIRWLEVAVDGARRLNLRNYEGAALGNLGTAYADLGETKLAIQFYEQRLDIAREIGDRRGEGNTLGNLGRAYAALGKTRQSIDFYEHQLVIAREIGDRRGESNAVCNLGTAYEALGETRRAIELHEQYKAIARELGDRRGEGGALVNLGIAYADLGETKRAIEFYEQALLIYREIYDRRHEAATLGNLGNSYKALGDPRRSMELHKQCLAIARETGDRRGEAAALGNLGNAHAALGDLKLAIEFYEQHLTIYRETGDRRGEGIALFNKSLALEVFGERSQAIANAEQAGKLLEQIEDPNAATVREQLAEWREE